MTNYYFWLAGWKYAANLNGELAEATNFAVALAEEHNWPIIVSDEGATPDHDELVKTYRMGCAPLSVSANGTIHGEALT